MSSETKETWTVMDIIRWGTDYFQNKGVDSPRLTIEMMLADILSSSRLQLYLMHDRPLTKVELSTLRDGCIRRGKREPLQYIMGNAHFYGLSFTVNPAVLIPRPETETVVDLVLNYVQSVDGPLNIHDLGTGSGCIAITLAHHLRTRTDITIHASDISENALEIARINAQHHDVEIKFSHQDMLSDGLKTDGIIVSNPPYVCIDDVQKLDPELSHEPRIALTDEYDGYTFYRAIAKHIQTHNQSINAFFLEIGYGQAVQVENYFAPFAVQVKRAKDLSGIERVVWGTLN